MTAKAEKRFPFCAGLLIYHDAQFLLGGLEPYFTRGPGVRGTASERNELEYQLARLSHHPSIASELPLSR